MDDVDVETSLNRWTGYTLWVYAIGFWAVATYLVPDGANLWWFGVFIAIYFPIMVAASNRANPLDRVSDERLDQFESWARLEPVRRLV